MHTRRNEFDSLEEDECIDSRVEMSHIAEVGSHSRERRVSSISGCTTTGESDATHQQISQTVSRAAPPSLKETRMAQSKESCPELSSRL